MPSRSRSRIITFIGGERVLGHPYNTTDQTILNSDENCDDVVGEKEKVNPLFLVRRTMNGPVLNGTTGLHSFSMYRCPVNIVSGPGKATVTNRHIGLAPRLLGQTGPLTPGLNVPRLIIELRDLPKMLRHAGDLLLKVSGRRKPLAPDAELAASTLAYQFGWAPLLGDLSKMLQVSAIIDRQHKRLEQAHSTRGLKRRINLSDGQTTTTVGSVRFLSTATASGTPRGYVSTETSSKTWGTVRWKVKDPLSFNRPPSREFAASVALGFRLGQIPVTAWQVLPWTWLIDWFADVANRLQATSNLLEYTPSGACIMETITTTDTWHVTKQPAAGLSLDGLVNRRVAKVRTPISAANLISNPIKLPYLDGFKLSILGSLAVLRLRGR